MMEFYMTQGGRRFIDGTMPEIAKQLKCIADAMAAAPNPMPIPKPPDIESLYQCTEKLLDLLRDPHPGLSTWNAAVRNKIIEISEGRDG